MVKGRKKRVNMRAVAEFANVSVATVSSILRGVDGAFKTSQATKDRVLAACEELGYHPNVHAQRMHSKQSRVLGFVFPSLEHHLDSEHTPDIVLAGLIQGATLAATRHGYQVMLVPATEDFYSKKNYLALFRSRSVDALLIWGVRRDESYVQELSENGMPFIQLQSKVDDECGRYNFVGVDNYAAGRWCARQVIENGHKKIGVIRGLQTSSVGADRWAGYREELSSAGVFSSDLVFDGNFCFKLGQEGARELLGRCPDMTAILCDGNAAAYGAMTHLTCEGLSVPDDVSITGSDAGPTYVDKTITTFACKEYDVGMAAVNMAIERLAGDAKWEDTFCKIIEPTYFQGNTVGPCK